jgi:hypothetical protein
MQLVMVFAANVVGAPDSIRPCESCHIVVSNNQPLFLCQCVGALLIERGDRVFLQSIERL